MAKQNELDASGTRQCGQLTLVGVRVGRNVSFNVQIIVWHIALFATIVTGTQPSIAITVADHLQLLVLDDGQLIWILSIVRVHCLKGNETRIEI